MASINFLALIALFSLIYIKEKVKAECGGYIEATSGTITSPLYPNYYPPGQRCYWEIMIPPTKDIWLHFKYFDLQRRAIEHFQGIRCGRDYVILKIKMNDGSVRDHGKYCGTQMLERNLIYGSSLQIEFVSDDSIQRKGFEMDFFTVPFECGGMLDGSEGIITSPEFPFEHPPGLNCKWNIQIPLNHNIELTFTDFTLEDSRECDQNYVAVSSTKADGEIREHGKFCGRKIPPVIDSENNILQIQFVSNTSIGNDGFKAKFLVSGRCGGLIEEGKGNISTPYFPISYPSNKICEWSFLVPPQHKIKLYFLHFEIEDGGDGCSNDFLLIQSKTAEGEMKELGKYCGASRPPTVYSKENILVTFVSDHSYQSKGFKAEYSIDKLTDYELSTTMMKPATPVYVPTKNSTAVNQKEIIERENATLRNETNVLSDALTSLREEIDSMKDTQKILLSNYEDLIKLSTLMTSKDDFLKDGGKNSSNVIERKLFNDCGKYIFFLRRILGSEP